MPVPLPKELVDASPLVKARWYFEHKHSVDNGWIYWQDLVPVITHLLEHLEATAAEPAEVKDGN